ncbi:MAG: hypothetical protein ACR2M3_03875 [Thermomicrobiales bacterium]
MTAQTAQRPVHLVGSVPLANEEDVFRTASAILGDRVRRIPDGETGVRTNWIGWQTTVFARNPSLEAVPDTGKEYGQLVQYRLRPGVAEDDIAFDNLGYADAAIASYQTFARLKREGTIPATTRFLVCLPTPLAPVTAFIERASQPAIELAYEARMLAEVDRIGATIPHDQLAIQWDTAVEFAILEGVGWQTRLDDVRGGIIDRLVRIGERVPPDVEMGYHLCYGDAGHQHFMQPKDAAHLVAVANDVSARLQRPINWIHMPVPRERNDEPFFAPLGNLTLHPETELYLGLVHYTDGVEGARKRIAAAQRFVPTFGIATECGFGRRPPETVVPLMAIHRDVADDAL